MKVPLLDLKPQYRSLKKEIDAAVGQVLESQQFILGEPVATLEQTLAHYCKCRYAIGVSSGTDALLAALMLEALGPGDEAITTPYTFFATAGTIARIGAKPVFVDINPVSYTIDPDQIEASITKKTKAIVPVHLFGQMAEMEPILSIAQTHQLIVIEDAAQAIGAEHKGRRAGSSGPTGCFSFFPSKNLGAAGDAGMVVTHDPDRARRLRYLRVHGADRPYQHPYIGGNFRLDALQAAILAAKVPYLDRWITARQNHAVQYNQLFAQTTLLDKELIRLPEVVTDRPVFHQYVIRATQRDALRGFLKEKGIETGVYYPLPLHLQPCFAYLGYQKGDFPESEQAADEALALPLYPELEAAAREYIVARIHEFYNA